ncbi:MAG: galactokinase family protein [Gemmiger sp.]|uniref:galactokinase n=1 Tax=Gemmiger sp. TaxID=2049027 RepID=UPI002E78D442|nr:galactokinase family protein [Gemmiger sp.]MEE0801413.1 galactokinase family protein [Gemmiger sp.]
MATSAELKQKIRDGQYDQAFAKLYAADPATVAAQRDRYLELLDNFEKNFGTGRTVSLYSAPGRTEIGGNHTDHNNGVVMAAAVNLDIVAVVSKNDDNIVRVISHGFGKIDDIDLSKLTPQKGEAEHSASLIRGVAAGIVNEGGKVGGFDCYTVSDVLRGSGLSSSAAFEVCMGAIFRGEYNDNDMEKFNQVEIAKISQYAENVFFGKPCGLMDQTACAVGSAITIDFKDPTAPVVNKTKFDLAGKGYALCISDTKGSHADLTDDYAAIRSEMESVAAFFGKKVLREVDEQEFLAAIPQVRKVTGDRAVVRAIHFYNDCRRAAELCDAIKADDFEKFKELIIAGGHSSFEYNQNAYSIKNPKEQGVPLALAISQKVLEGRGAWRLQGGGFAGTIQAFVPLDLLEKYKAAIDAVFGAGSCHVLSVRNYGAVPVTPDM